MTDGEIVVARMRVLTEQRTAIIARRNAAQERVGLHEIRLADAKADLHFEQEELRKVEAEIEELEASPAWVAL